MQKPIAGVTHINVTEIKSYKVSFDPAHTNGHTFCTLTVDEQSNRFTAVLYGGESYTYSWGAPGDNFIQFLIHVFSDADDYLFNKLADSSLSSYVDRAKTARNIKKRLLRMYRNRELYINHVHGGTLSEKVREAWEEITDFENASTPAHEHSLYDWWERDFTSLIELEVVPEEPHYEDAIEYEEDVKCRIFCETIAPLLAQVLLQVEAGEHVEVV